MSQDAQRIDPARVAVQAALERGGDEIRHDECLVRRGEEGGGGGVGGDGVYWVEVAVGVALYR